MAKIAGNDFSKLAVLILETARTHETKQAYAAKGYTATRYYWDVFHATTDRLQRAGRVADYSFIRDLYNYANDDHIETALKNILK